MLNFEGLFRGGLTTMANLDGLTVGAIPLNPITLLASHRMESLLQSKDGMAQSNQ